MRTSEGGHDLRQRAGSSDRTGHERLVITVAQHDRHGNEAHGHDRGRNHARCCAQKRADKHDGIGQPAPDRPKELADRVEQVFRHARPLQDDPHEGEEGNRQQRIVVHDPVDALGMRLQQRPEQIDRRRQMREFDADGEEGQTAGGEREGDGIAEHKQRHDRREHDRREIFYDKFKHISAPPRHDRQALRPQVDPRSVL